VLHDHRAVVLVKALDAMHARRVALALIVASVVRECRGRNTNRSDSEDDFFNMATSNELNNEPIGLFALPT